MGGGIPVKDRGRWRVGCWVRSLYRPRAVEPGRPCRFREWWSWCWYQRSLSYRTVVPLQVVETSRRLTCCLKPLQRAPTCRNPNTSLLYKTGEIMRCDCIDCISNYCSNAPVLPRTGAPSPQPPRSLNAHDDFSPSRDIAMVRIKLRSKSAPTPLSKSWNTA